MNKKTRNVAIIGLVLALVVLLIVLMQMLQPAVTGCPEDAKICLDGTVVVRIPPTCEFEECPSVNESILGHWEGAIRVLGADLIIMLDFETEEKATIDIPQQGATGLTLSNVSFDPPRVHFEIMEVGAVFDGELKDGEISGEFEQSGISGTFNLKRKEKEIVPYEEPPPYIEEEVTFQNGNITLVGTLTLPEGESPFPTVVLISGSGAQNRDEDVFGFKIFRVIADNFTRSGIAVLRYDDRGVGNSTWVPNATSEDFARDVEAAVKLLKNRSEISKIGLLGHSEGGIVASMVESDDVSFIILMAGPAIKGDELLIAQLGLLLRAENISEERLQKQKELQNKTFAAVRSGEGWDELEEEMRQMIRNSIDELPEDERKDIVNAEEFINATVNPQMALSKSAWFRFFIDYDPSQALRELTVPVLAIFGELDLQVPAEMNKAAIEKALENNTDATIVVLPKANHLFQEAVIGSITEYAELEKDFVPGFLDLMTEWILERVE